MQIKQITFNPVGDIAAICGYSSMQVQATPITDRNLWNATLAQMPSAHVLQSWEWGEFKQATTGWEPKRIAYLNRGEVVAMAQVLTRRAGPFKIMYVPKGPVLDYTDQPLRVAVLNALKYHTRESGAIFLKIDPDVVIGTGVPGELGSQEVPLGHAVAAEWTAQEFTFSPDQVQFRNSMLLDLRYDEDALMMAMKQKTRYNVRLSQKRGVTTRFGGIEDMQTLYHLYVETARRDGFITRPFSYYSQAWGSFMEAGLAQPIIAEHRGQAVAHVIIFGFGKRAWYFYGASSDDDRNNMPTYLLQWEAIRWARAQKMATYDFWGAPDDFYDENDALAGVYRFKAGFGGTVVRRIGAWDYPANPRLYRLYTQVMPSVLNLMRGVGRRRLRRETPSAT